MMAETELKKLGSPEYWDERYKDENESHEWFRSFAKLQSFLREELPQSSTRPVILHLGCGDSTLTSELAALGYRSQISIDFSETIIAQMRSRYPNLDWRIGDVRHLQIDDCSVKTAIDKGTMDAMLYGSVWDPPPEVQENVAKYVSEVARVLQAKGISLFVLIRSALPIKHFGSACVKPFCFARAQHGCSINSATFS